jgi:hypothetical protein
MQVSNCKQLRDLTTFVTNFPKGIPIHELMLHQQMNKIKLCEEDPWDLIDAIHEHRNYLLNGTQSRDNPENFEIIVRWMDQCADEVKKQHQTVQTKQKTVSQCYNDIQLTIATGDCLTPPEHDTRVQVHADMKTNTDSAKTAFDVIQNVVRLMNKAVNQWIQVSGKQDLKVKDQPGKRATPQQDKSQSSVGTQSNNTSQATSSSPNPQPPVVTTQSNNASVHPPSHPQSVGSTPNLQYQNELKQYMADVNLLKEQARENIQNIGKLIQQARQFITEASHSPKLEQQSQQPPAYNVALSSQNHLIQAVPSQVTKTNTTVAASSSASPSNNTPNPPIEMPIKIESVAATPSAPLLDGKSTVVSPISTDSVSASSTSTNPTHPNDATRVKINELSPPSSINAILVRLGVDQSPYPADDEPFVGVGSHNFPVIDEWMGLIEQKTLNVFALDKTLRVFLSNLNWYQNHFHFKQTPDQKWTGPAVSESLSFMNLFTDNVVKFLNESKDDTEISKVLLLFPKASTHRSDLRFQIEPKVKQVQNQDQDLLQKFAVFFYSFRNWVTMANIDIEAQRA